MINQKNNDLITYYSDAISSYGNSEYAGCISNCRSLLESIAEEIPTKEDAPLCLRATEDILIWYYQNYNSNN